MGQLLGGSNLVDTIRVDRPPRDHDPSTQSTTPILSRLTLALAELFLRTC